MLLAIFKFVLQKRVSKAIMNICLDMHNKHTSVIYFVQMLWEDKNGSNFYFMSNTFSKT